MLRDKHDKDSHGLIRKKNNLFIYFSSSSSGVDLLISPDFYRGKGVFIGCLEREDIGDDKFKRGLLTSYHHLFNSLSTAFSTMRN